MREEIDRAIRGLSNVASLDVLIGSAGKSLEGFVNHIVPQLGEQVVIQDKLPTSGGHRRERFRHGQSLLQTAG
jgi:hypothetical protein